MTARDSEPYRDPELMGDLDAAVQTRKELGETYEREIIDSFLAKVEQRIAGTVDQRCGVSWPSGRWWSPPEAAPRTRQAVVARGRRSRWRRCRWCWPSHCRRSPR